MTNEDNDTPTCEITNYKKGMLIALVKHDVHPDSIFTQVIITLLTFMLVLIVVLFYCHQRGRINLNCCDRSNRLTTEEQNSHMDMNNNKEDMEKPLLSEQMRYKSSPQGTAGMQKSGKLRSSENSSDYQ